MEKTTIRENNTLKNLLYVALFVALFIVIHSVFEFGTVAIYAYLKANSSQFAFECCRNSYLY